MYTVNRKAFPWDHTQALREDWSGLTGFLVEVRLSGHRVAAGMVEAVSSEGDHIWIAAEGVNTRKLYDKPSGYEVWAQGNT
ncbi:hypothetical protein [Pseudarthrobacter sp. CCNWLW207]|uniref:hypothetical protein n=1 Tax=Pseudarthrobacter sp. CCNWLW207 TaxID=3127468 RepID=UPI003076C3D5